MMLRKIYSVLILFVFLYVMDLLVTVSYTIMQFNSDRCGKKNELSFSCFLLMQHL